MSSDLAASVENVSKCYHVYDRNFDRLKQSMVVGETKYYREFWALRDISFTVRRGETIGIIGANGSGKSTLLQILFGVLNPTAGRVKVHGKVRGLLELGAGFNPEETGRQNILINAAILGVPPRDIPELFEKIAAFADIGEFLDQPVKVYSSGMAVRLGFALQISVPCDILIVDEALAVGDELFQRRCYAALENFRSGGGTVMLVSHAASSIKELCRRAIFLDHGRLIQQGNTKVVVDNYQKFLYMREPERSHFRDSLLQHAEEAAQDHAVLPGEAAVGDETALAAAPIAAPAAAGVNLYDQGVDRNPPAPDYEEGLTTKTAMYYQPIGANITRPRIETLDGRLVNILNPRERYRFCYRVEFTGLAQNVVFGWLVKSTSGLELGGGAHDAFEGFVRQTAPGQVYDLQFEFTVNLFPGVYYLNCGVSGTLGDYDGFLHRVIDGVAFRVRNLYAKVHAGFVDFDYRSAYQLVDAETAAVVHKNSSLQLQQSIE